MSSKPNIVIFLTDDQRFDTIHALGNQEIMTPNLDCLVENGTAFTHAHNPGGMSGAICMPSRAMFHTGRTLFHIEREGQNIPDCHITIGEAFRKAGYRTFGTGKWHNGTASYGRSFADGENIFFGGMWDHWNVPVCRFDPSGKYENRISFTDDFTQSNKTMDVHCDSIAAGRHSTELFSQSAIDFIQRYDSEEPFLMYVSYLAPHDPRTMPQRYRQMYDPDRTELPANFMGEHPFDYGVRSIRDELLASYPRTEAETKRHIAEYYAMISHLDDEIGRVLLALEQAGKMEDTIMVLAGDHGLAVGQHGLMGKQNHYEHSIRVPLLFCGPGVPKGLQLGHYVYLLDVFPTLCELAGIPIPASVEGNSLLTAMERPEAGLRNTLYCAYRDTIRSTKDKRFKLIEYAGDVRTTQLFDLERDPHEMTNLFGQENYKAIVAGLRQEMIRYREDWDERAHPLGQSFWDKVEGEFGGRPRANSSF